MSLSKFPCVKPPAEEVPICLNSVSAFAGMKNSWLPTPIRVFPKNLTKRSSPELSKALNIVPLTFATCFAISLAIGALAIVLNALLPILEAPNPPVLADMTKLSKNSWGLSCTHWSNSPLAAAVAPLEAVDIAAPVSPILANEVPNNIADIFMPPLCAIYLLFISYLITKA